MKYLKKLAPALLLTANAILVGCDDSTYVAPPPPPPPPTTQSQFGTGFEAEFNKDKFVEPNPVVDGNVIDLDKTIEPVDIPDPGQ